MFNKTNKIQRIVKYSNVIQYDEMGYPLRLVIANNGEQLWIDTMEKNGDVVLKWVK